jgi:hypothetical protein
MDFAAEHPGADQGQFDFSFHRILNFEILLNHLSDFSRPFSALQFVNIIHFREDFLPRISRISQIGNLSLFIRAIRGCVSLVAACRSARSASLREKREHSRRVAEAAEKSKTIGDRGDSHDERFCLRGNQIRHFAVAVSFP